jgi:hypothetical protein
MIDRSIDSTDLLTCFDAYCLCVVGVFFLRVTPQKRIKSTICTVLILTVASGIVPMFALFNRSR